jgi:DNA-binding response OmpR family regulator
MRKILIAEDNKDLNMILVKRLEASGFAVDSVATGYALMAHLKVGVAPDAIVLDLMLPGRSGAELLGTIMETWADTKVFIFSAYAESSEKHMLKNYSISGYFCKSDGMDKLIAAIKTELVGTDDKKG